MNLIWIQFWQQQQQNEMEMREQWTKKKTRPFVQMQVNSFNEALHWTHRVSRNANENVLYILPTCQQHRQTRLATVYTRTSHARAQHNTHTFQMVLSVHQHSLFISPVLSRYPFFAKPVWVRHTPSMLHVCVCALATIWQQEKTVKSIYVVCSLSALLLRDQNIRQQWFAN